MKLYSKNGDNQAYLFLYEEPDHLQIVGCEQAICEYVPVELF